MSLRNTSRHRRVGVLVQTLVLVSAVGVAAMANAADQPKVNQFRITKQVIAAGGARATGGPYTLVGTVGQTVAGRTEARDTLLQQGFHAHPDNRSELVLKDSFESIQ